MIKATLTVHEPRYGTDGVLISMIPAAPPISPLRLIGDSPRINLSPKIGLDYKTSWNLLYATYSRGYRGGSSMGSHTSCLRIVDSKSETVSDYEIGSKTSLLDRRLELNTQFLLRLQESTIYRRDPLTGAQPSCQLPYPGFRRGTRVAARPIPALRITGALF